MLSPRHVIGQSFPPFVPASPHLCALRGRFATCRLCFEASILVSAGNKYMNGVIHSPAPDPNAPFPPENCQGWTDKQSCDIPGGWVLATSIGLISTSGLYFICYCICMCLVYRQLSQQRFAAARTTNILFQIQVWRGLPLLWTDLLAAVLDVLLLHMHEQLWCMLAQCFSSDQCSAARVCMLWNCSRLLALHKLALRAGCTA